MECQPPRGKLSAASRRTLEAFCGRNVRFVAQGIAAVAAPTRVARVGAATAAISCTHPTNANRRRACRGYVAGHDAGSPTRNATRRPARLLEIIEQREPL